MAAPMKLLRCTASAAVAWQRGFPRFFGQQLRCFSLNGQRLEAAAAEENPDTGRDFFRTGEDCPANHGVQHVGQYYSIPTNQVKRILPVGCSTRWEQMIGTFNESAIMVRQPAVEIIDYLKRSNYDHPPARYVLYGRQGSGKTMSLSHVIHYCHSQDWIIVHIPCVNLWNSSNKGRFDYIDSVRHEGMYDRPALSADWLKQFRLRNENSLKQLVTGQSYEWSRREVTQEGQPLLAVVEQGINRPKNASDAIGVLLKELQRQSNSGAFKMLYVVKSVNGLFADKTIIRKPGGYIIPVKEMTMVKHFKKLLEGKWTNGAIVASVDQHQTRPMRPDYKPLHLLGKEGFEMMDPFVPIFVDNYSDKEFESCMAYYKAKRWLQNEFAHTEDGMAQLRFLTERNPGTLQRVCAPL